MAEMKGEKKRLSINLSFLTLSDSTKRANSRYSPTHYEGPNGVVGLGILAAMKYDRQPRQDPFFNNSAALAISPKSASNSICVIKSKNSSENSSSKKISAAELEGLEEYTCVISHVGKNLVEKKVYFDAEIMGTRDGFAGFLTGNGGGGGETAAFVEADFLSSCVLCEKKLHGLDVFMYRGDKAFCSTECRCKQISMDEQREKCYSKARRARMKHSVSPCSVAAA